MQRPRVAAFLAYYSDTYRHNPSGTALRHERAPCRCSILAAISMIGFLVPSTPLRLRCIVPGPPPSGNPLHDTQDCHTRSFYFLHSFHRHHGYGFGIVMEGVGAGSVLNLAGVISRRRCNMFHTGSSNATFARFWNFSVDCQLSSAMGGQPPIYRLINPGQWAGRRRSGIPSSRLHLGMLGVQDLSQFWKAYQALRGGTDRFGDSQAYIRGMAGFDDWVDEPGGVVIMEEDVTAGKSTGASPILDSPGMCAGVLPCGARSAVREDDSSPDGGNPAIYGSTALIVGAQWTVLTDRLGRTIALQMTHTEHRGELPWRVISSSLSG